MHLQNQSEWMPFFKVIGFYYKKIKKYIWYAKFNTFQITMKTPLTKESTKKKLVGLGTYEDLSFAHKDKRAL